MFISKRNMFLILALVLMLSIVLRFWNISKFGFGTDELYHVIAAESILNHGEPVFPSGDLYTRSIGFTHVVAFFFKFLGSGETIARFPSIIFNIIFLLASFLITRKITDNATALLFLIVMSFSPFSLNLVRQCRMYAPFQLFYFLGSMSFFFGFEYNWSGISNKLSRRPTWFEKRYRVNLILLALSSFFFLISLSFHQLTKTFVVAILSYAICMGVIEWAKRGLMAFLFSKYGLVCLGALAATTLLLLLNPSYLVRHFEMCQSMLPWMAHYTPSVKYYYYFLTENYSVLFFLYPIGFLYLLSKNKRLALFLMCSFVPLFFMHSVLIKMKLTRYIFHIFPFFVLVAVPIASKLISHLWSLNEKDWIEKGWLNRVAAMAALLIALNVFCYPWLMNSRKVVSSSPFGNWKEFYEKTGKYFEKNAVIIATNQNSIYYYFGDKPDFYLRAEYFMTKRDAEYFAGAQAITKVEELETITERNEIVYFLTNNWKLKNQVYVTSDILAFIKKHYEEVSLGYQTTIKLYKKMSLKEMYQ